MSFGGVELIIGDAQMHVVASIVSIQVELI
jgi:hypothetical protein